MAGARTDAAITPAAQRRRSNAAYARTIVMSVTHDPKSSGKLDEAPTPAVVRESSPGLLTEQELDRVAAAGSKPGMVGDGRRSPSLSVR
jgi:hypothetical protein